MSKLSFEVSTHNMDRQSEGDQVGEGTCIYESVLMEHLVDL